MRIKILRTVALTLAAGLVLSNAAPSSPQGIITAREFLGIGGTALASLTNHAKFPNSPDVVAYPARFEWPTTADGSPPPGDVKNDYGVQIIGYLHPPTTGDYVFAIAADDNAVLFLSTDDNPANKTAIASEPQWNPVRAFSSDARRNLVDVGTANERYINVSRPIRLQAGRAYYIEALVKEGGGGDNLAVAWAKPGEAPPQDGGDPIPGEFLSTIDRLSLATPYVAGFSGGPTGFSFRVQKGSGTSAASINPNSVKVTFNNASVTPEISTQGDVTTIKYATPALLPPGSTNSVRLEFADTATPSQTQTVEKSFVVGNFPIIPAFYAVTADTTKPGFNVKVHQVSSVIGFAQNSNARTEAQLAGLLKDDAGNPAPNLADPNAVGIADGPASAPNPANAPISFVVSKTINMSQDGTDNAGNFRPDDVMPGIPGIEGSTDNIGMEITTFLDLPAGLITMGVNSDDGFVTSIMAGPGDKFPIVLGQFDGGRGAADTIFQFVIEKAGVYPFRTIWEEGGGGANIEWFTVNDAGTKVLVNDTATPGHVKAYRTATGGGLPLVTTLAPTPNSTVPLNAKIEVSLQDGAKPINPSSVQLKLNDAPVNATVNRTGTTTTISYSPVGGFPQSTRINVDLAVSDTSTPPITRNIKFSFTTERLPLTVGAFQQENDGLVVMEGENFHKHTPQGTHTWTFSTTARGYSGDGYMEAVPNAGINRSGYPELLTDSPRLDYKVSFVKSGTHYVWIRGMAPGAAAGTDPGANDSVHAGINGDNPETARRIDVTFPGDVWALVGTIQGGARATIDVPSAGEHTVNIWMREDGFRLDKIIITSVESFTPSGLGPQASRHVGQAPPPTVGISSPADNATFAVGANIAITATATASTGHSIAKVEFFNGDTKLGEVTSAPFTFTIANAAQGRLSITAKATDSQGLSTISAPVRIVVGTPAEEILLIHASAGISNASDLAIKARLESFGFAVRTIGATAAKPGDEAGTVLVIASSTIASGDLADKMRFAAVPLITWEQALQDNFLMTLDQDGVTRGSQAGQTEIDIINANHPLAAGLPRGVRTVSASTDFSWGTPGPSATVIATITSDPTRAVIYAYDKGATLVDGTTKAPEKRIYFLMTDNTYLALNADGIKLFDAAVSWALGRTLGVQPKFNPPTVQGGNLVLTWTGGGTLQSADDITGPWTDVAGATSPRTVPITGARKFYRLKQ